MDFPEQYTLFLILAPLATLAAVWLMVYVWRYRNLRETSVLFWLVAVVVGWLILNTLETIATTGPQKLLWAKVTYFFIAATPVIWLLFALRYSGRAAACTPRRILLYSVIPAITALLALTSSRHTLLWRSYDFVLVGRFLTWRSTHGPWFWVHVVYSYILVFAGAAVLIRHAFKSEMLYRRQTFWIVSGALLPIATNLVNITRLIPHVYKDFTSISFAGASLAFAIGIFRYRLFDLIPIAREVVFERMPDAVFTVDARGRIVDLNPAAQALTGQSPAFRIGQPVVEALPAWKAWFQTLQAPEEEELQTDLTLDCDGRLRDYEVQISALHRVRGERDGWIVLLHEITKRKQAQAILQQYSEQLKGMVVERTRGLEAAQAQLLAQQRLQQEIELAAQIQTSLLPAHVPAFDGYEFAAMAIPSRYVSGDLYDFIVTGPETCHIVVADIAGKGVPAALLSSTARTLIRAETDHETSPGRMLTNVNASFYRDLAQAEMFITFLAARLDARSGTLAYANAGHTAALWWRQATGRCEMCPATGLPIGVLPDATVEERVLALHPGDTLVFYSDGIPEATNAAGEFFGMERLAALVDANPHLSAAGLMQYIVGAVEVFVGSASHSDDITLLVLKVLPRVLSFDCEAVLDNLHEIATLVRRAAQPYGETFAYAVELATSEIASNIIKHAYGTASGRIRGVLQVLPDRLQLDLYDDGAPFDPNALKPPDLGELHEGGYGLFIAQKVLDELRYTARTAQGNHWKLVKLEL
jgi:PAS domain S-box-containing protein